MNKIDKILEELLSKKGKRAVLKYFIISFFTIIALMLLHRPATFYNGTYIEYIKYMYELGYIHELFLRTLIWVPVMASLLFLFRTKYIGIFFIGLFSFLAGTEMYYFFLQGGNLAWNIGVNQLMVENIIKAIENPVLMNEASNEYSNTDIFKTYMIYYPIGLTIFIYIITKLLPKGKYNLIGLPIFLILMTFATEQSTPYFLRVIYEFEDYGLQKINNLIINKKRENIYIKDIQNKSPKNIIFVMDESVRGDYISVNSNDKEIVKATKYLQELENNGTFKTFGVMYPIGNCSASSNVFTMIGGRKNYEVAPTIYQYMKNAGYQTIRLDAPHTGYQNGVERYDTPYIDKYISNESIPENTKRDLVSIKNIKEILKENKKHFIYFTKQGSHFPVKNSYPKNKALFKNLGKPYSQEWYKKQYLNSLNWNVNEFWKQLVQATKNTDTVIIWQSDHGLNIGPDNGQKHILLTHCESNLDHYKALFNSAGGIYSDNKNYLKDFKNLNESSANQIFPTILNLAGYNEDNIEKYYWPSFNVKDIKNNFPLFTPSHEIFYILNPEDNNLSTKEYGINKRKKSYKY